MSIAVDLTDDASWSLPPAPKEIETDREIERDHGWSVDVASTRLLPLPEPPE